MLVVCLAPPPKPLITGQRTTGMSAAYLLHLLLKRGDELLDKEDGLGGEERLVFCLQTCRRGGQLHTSGTLRGCQQKEEQPSLSCVSVRESNSQKIRIRER